MRFNRLFLVLAVSVLSVGCSPTGRSSPIEGSAAYSLNGKEIAPPNQVRVENPYTFMVEVEWQDQKIQLQAHGSRLIIFEGMMKPGAIRAWKIEDGKRVKELTYATLNAQAFGSGKVYQIR